ncbi:MAG: hypothetical protein NUW01_08320 [Gemmatimonadaceae bacterium]|nr:hypothetical protein [Gemmatimonadaceae bacterium]
MRSLARTAVAVLLALAGVQATAEAQTRAKPVQDRNRIDAEEIRARPVTSLNDLIKSRRPHWLSTRGSATLRTRTAADPFGGPALNVGVEPAIIVYVDNVRHGSHEVLRSMSTDDVDSLEYLDAMTATQRFGTGHEYGAILIRRRVR